MSPGHSTSATSAPSARPYVAGIPRYAPGRTASDAMDAWGLDRAVKLASNESPFGPLPGVVDAIATSLTDVGRYGDHLAWELRERLATRAGVSPEQVAVGCGSVGLLQQIVQTFAGPGDEVVFPWPSFIAYPQFVVLSGATEVSVPLRRCSFDVDAILAAITPRTRLLLLANPNNPIPTAMRSGELERLLDAVPAGVLVIVDEAYHEYVTGSDVPDALELVDGRPHVGVLRTFSKAYGLAGLRVGFLVADPSVVQAVDTALTPFSVNVAAQAAAMAAMDAEDEVARRAAIVVSERGRVEQALRRRGLGMPAGEGNFVWLPIGGGASGPLAIAMERRGVVTRPMPTGVRVTIGHPEENDAFLSALDSAMVEDPSAREAWTLPTGDVSGRVADVLDAIHDRADAAETSDAAARRFDRLGALVAELSTDEWAALRDVSDDELLDWDADVLAGRVAPLR